MFPEELTHPQWSTLRAALLALDDEGLTTLASRGLVRRARKDLENISSLSIEIENNAALTVSIEEFIVRVGEIPTAAVCSCPATGACRHVITVLMYLRNHVAEAVARPSEGMATSAIAPAPLQDGVQEIITLSDDQLQKWAGQTIWRKALRLAAIGAAEIQAEANLVVRFPTRNVTCRWIPGGGLESMICSCHAPRACEHRAAAVLVVQARHGIRSLESEDAAIQAAAGAPRTREEVRASVAEALREMVSLGLSRLSPAMGDRLQTLSVSAHGVDFPRFERVLQTLVDDINAVLGRTARASTPVLLATAARAEALQAALARPTPSLVGRHRSQYDAVGDIYLQGIGARRWRSRSGFVGLTVYFWDESAANWATWTDARPVDTAVFDPEGRYFSPGPWEGCPSPEIASRNRMRVTNVWRNGSGRLSGRGSTAAFVEQDTNWLGAPRRIHDWREAVQQAARRFGGGLHERTEQDEIVLLMPRTWGEATFDSIHQELMLQVIDEDGRSLPLVLGFREETAGAVSFLETHDVRQIRAVLGLLRFGRGRVSVEPVTLIEDERFINLTLDVPRQPVQAQVMRSSSPGATFPAARESLDDEAALPLAASGAKLGQSLTILMHELEAIAESGVAANHDLQVIGDATERLTQLGAAAVVTVTRRLIADLERARKTLAPENRAQAAGSLLRAYYVARLAAEHNAFAATAAFS